MKSIGTNFDGMKNLICYRLEAMKFVSNYDLEKRQVSKPSQSITHRSIHLFSYMLQIIIDFGIFKSIDTQPLSIIAFNTRGKCDAFN
jgi:hypothetical protein